LSSGRCNDHVAYKSDIDDEFAVMVKTKSFKRKQQLQKSAAAVNSFDNRQTPLKFNSFDVGQKAVFMKNRLKNTRSRGSPQNRFKDNSSLPNI
jgi:hypothetical protein